MVPTRPLAWIAVSIICGILTLVVLSRFALGLVQSDARAMSFLAAALVFGLQFVRLRAPTDAPARDRANLSPPAKMIVLLVFGLGTAVALASAVLQGIQGYPHLTPAALISAPIEPALGFYSAKGRPVLDALYTMGSDEDGRFLVPIEEYEGRLLVMVSRRPPNRAVRLTGRLRTDVRAVQSRAPGEIDGPFRQLYREHMRLPPNTPIYFLDTGMRAGLNFRAVVWVVMPLYIFLLIWGAPTQDRRRVTRRRLG